MPTFIVSSAAGLSSALRTASAGDRIVLAAGDYGDVSINGAKFAGVVTIESASEGAPAHFDRLTVTGSSKLTISGVDVGRSTLSGERTDSLRMTIVRDSQDITIKNSVIHGSSDGVWGNDGSGLLASNATRLSLTGNTFEDLRKAVSVEKSSSITISGNLFRDNQIDGVNIASTNGVVLDSNVFTDFRPMPGDHADAIQFYNTGQERGTMNARVTNNIIYQGDGIGTQGIFVSDPNGFEFRNFIIENNLIYGNDLYHGIYVKGGRTVRIANNTVVSANDDREMMWIRVELSSNINLKNNISDKIVVDNGNTGVSNQIDNINLFQKPHLRSLFADLDTPESLSDIIAAGVGYVPSLLGFDLTRPRLNAESLATPPAEFPEFAAAAFEINEVSGLDLLPMPQERFLADGLLGHFVALP